MSLSREMRLLQNKWLSGTSWPKRLESIAIDGVRGWTGQRIEFRFPIVAICGENGSGKSTILQTAASAYNAPDGKHLFASDFFPDTPWEAQEDVTLSYWAREGEKTLPYTVRKKTTRWRGSPQRREREVIYVDLARTQPVSSRTGYARLAKPSWKEVSSKDFDTDRTSRLSDIMGRKYDSSRNVLTDGDDTRAIPVLSLSGTQMSGYHQGAGELTVAEFLRIDPKKNSLLLIDEIETSLHPRAQRRLIRDLASLCKEREIQIILTTHSPFILSELPPEARSYILRTGPTKEVVSGVSPNFALAKMDEESHPDADVFVEDERAKDLLREIIVKVDPEMISRVQIIPFGTANVGKALGIMVSQGRFPRSTLVFLDGDQEPAPGCLILPGGDAPERVVFEGLAAANWGNLAARTGRQFASTADVCSRSMLGANHHDWVLAAANALTLPAGVLWQAMCAEWAEKCLTNQEGLRVMDTIAFTIQNHSYSPIAATQPPAQSPSVRPATISQPAPSLPSNHQAAPAPQQQDSFHSQEGELGLWIDPQ